MLTLLLPASTTLLIPALSPLFWWSTPTLLILLTLVSLSKTLQCSQLFLMSNLTNLDIQSSILISLTIWISCLMFQASYKINFLKNNPKLFLYSSVTLLLSLLLCFSACNLFYFYIWFEASLIPTMFLIMMWGYQPERIQASMYLMLYTVTASLPLLMAIFMILHSSGHNLIPYPFLSLPSLFDPSLMMIITMSAFLAKLPLFILHLWLPKAHVEAPVAGSMILAAILLKLGGYGLLRFTFMFPQITFPFNSLMISISLVGGVITSMICLRQPDLKSIIAYSSIGHMGLMCAGIMTNTMMGLSGALAMMIAHGFSSSALFCLANISYEKTHTRSLPLTKGFLILNPSMTLWWFLILSTNMAAPPSINLLSEIMLIISSISFSMYLALPLMSLSFLSVAYSLFIYSSINHGHPSISSNSMHPLFCNQFLLLLMHLLPASVLIFCPTLITHWL